MYDVTIDVNIEFPQHCDTSDMQFTQLEEPFDEDYIEEVFNRICFLRGNFFSDYNISVINTGMQLRKHVSIK